MRMRENMAELVGGGVYRLLDEQPEKASEILESFFNELSSEKKADKLLYNSIDTLMNVMDYENLAVMIQEEPAHEDFSLKQNNHRKQEFDRKWHHTRTKINVHSLNDMDENVPAGGYSVEDQAI